MFLHSGYCLSLDYAFQMLELAGGKKSFECLDLFRHLMVDIMSMTIYGFHHGALKNLSMGIEDPLSMAVNDFPKRGVIVRFPTPLRGTHCPADHIHSGVSFPFGLGISSVKSQTKGGKSCVILIESWLRYDTRFLCLSVAVLQPHLSLSARNFTNYAARSLPARFRTTMNGCPCCNGSSSIAPIPLLRNACQIKTLFQRAWAIRVSEASIPPLILTSLL